MNIFNLHSMLGRSLLAAFIFVITVISAAWLAQSRVNQAEQQGFQNTSIQQTAGPLFYNLEIKFTKSLAYLQEFMLLPEPKIREKTLGFLQEIINDKGLARLRRSEFIDGYPATKQHLDGFIKDMETLKTEVANLMDVRVNVERLYPATEIMSSGMLPENIRFRTNTMLAMNEATDGAGITGKRKVYQLFVDVRDLWASMIGAYRLYVANRSGLYGNPERGMEIQKQNITIYGETISEMIDALSEMDAAGELEFQQSDSLVYMKEAFTNWMGHYQRALKIYESNNWRTDILLLRNKIQPLTTRIRNHFVGIDKDVGRATVTKLTNVSAVAKSLSESIWIIVGATIAAIGGVLIAFELGLRRPVTRVTHALKEFAHSGDGENQQNNSNSFFGNNTEEAKELIDAFRDMKSQVNSRQTRLRAILDNAAEAIITTDENGIIESFNVAAEKLFGYQTEEVIGKNISILMRPETGEKHDTYMQSYISTGTPDVIGEERELPALHKNGSELQVSLKISEMRLEGRRLFSALIADISERKQMLNMIQSRQEYLETILDNAAEGIITFDENGLIKSCNRAAENLFGYRSAEIVGQNLSVLIPPEGRDQRDDYLEHFMRNKVQALLGHEGEVQGRTQNGRKIPMALKVSRIFLENEPLYIGLIADISERKAILENLRQMAEYDGLTGLHNRSYFQEELERVVERARRGQSFIANLLYIDLDNFKYVNDTMGHAAGDHLLIEVAGILNKRVRKGDMVARYGGDEFAVLLYDSDAQTAFTVAESFRKHMVDYRFMYQGKVVDIGCTVGVATIEATCLNGEMAISRADLACNIAKRAGRNRVRAYSPGDDASVAALSIDMGWSTQIKEALESDNFILCAQPIVSTHDLQVNTYEILLRMIDSDGDQIMPAGFIPSAERFGLMGDIDHWVIESSIRELAKYQRGYPDLRFTINLSGHTLTDITNCDFIQSCIKRAGIDCSSITFEVTETTAIADLATASEFLSRLKSLGCKTALDDFGTGMSSFAYLKDLPIDIVKIDGLFVQNLADNPVDQAMVKAMGEIAHALGKEVVAEFVENEASLNLLQEYKIDFAQGYLLGRPVQIETLFATKKSSVV